MEQRNEAQNVEMSKLTSGWQEARGLQNLHPPQSCGCKFAIAFWHFIRRLRGKDDSYFQDLTKHAYLEKDDKYKCAWMGFRF